jgi:hypothetical protein
LRLGGKNIRFRLSSDRRSFAQAAKISKHSSTKVGIILTSKLRALHDLPGEVSVSTLVAALPRQVLRGEYSTKLLMSSLFRDYVASVRPRGEPFRSRSMVLCLAGHHPILSIGGNARRQGLKTTFALLCPRSPGLTPRSLFGYLIVDSLITQKNSFHLRVAPTIHPLRGG